MPKIVSNPGANGAERKSIEQRTEEIRKGLQAVSKNNEFVMVKEIVLYLGCSDDTVGRRMSANAEYNLPAVPYACGGTMRRIIDVARRLAELEILKQRKGKQKNGRKKTSVSFDAHQP